MQVSFSRNENEFKVPHYKVGDEVLAFSYISGKFFVGTISAVTSYADNNQSVVNYTIMIDENKGVPNIPESLVFDNKEDARAWIKSMEQDLVIM
nr:MAG TPA: E3 ubiquitin-protein ligase [Crassvirales sp.]